jgi:3-methyladenine DNA glycosylase AlkD
MEADGILARLKSLANPEAVDGMARYGINPHNTLGVSIPILRGLAKQIGIDHELAAQLWASGIHEARILASLVDDPRKVSEAQMDSWAADFDSWDICDQVCSNLFCRTPFAGTKAVQWSAGGEEYVRRAGFVLMAGLAVRDKKSADAEFMRFFPLMVQAATDERNYVKKAVNWALRGIGKRNLALNAKAIQIAQEIKALDSRSARWIASDALRELTGEAVQRRLLHEMQGK